MTSQTMGKFLRVLSEEESRGLTVVDMYAANVKPAEANKLLRFN